MANVLITGMSGTGKSTVLEALGARGHRVVDTDTDEWSVHVTLDDGQPDWIWREVVVERLLRERAPGHLFVAGCKSNQGVLYSLFDEIVVLYAPAETLIERIAARRNNPYGQTPEQLAEVLTNQDLYESRLRRSATIEIDATQSIEHIVGVLERALTHRTTNEK